jgi:hypothetical protein
MSKDTRPSFAIPNPPSRTTKGRSNTTPTANPSSQTPSQSSHLTRSGTQPLSLGEPDKEELLKQIYNAVQRLSEKVDNVEESLQRIEKRQDEQMTTLIQLTVYFL